MLSKKEIKQVYNNLKNGKKYSNGFRGFYFDGQFIRWCNYGSSAEKFTLKNVDFIVNEIFDGYISHLKIYDKNDHSEKSFIYA